MSIKVYCSSCNAGFTAPEKHAGKKTKCPKCGGQIEIPLLSPSAGSARYNPSGNQTALANKPSALENGKQTHAWSVKNPTVVVGVACVTVTVVIVFAMIWNLRTPNSVGLKTPLATNNFEYGATDVPLPKSSKPTHTETSKSVEKWSPPFKYRVTKQDAHNVFATNSAHHNIYVETTVDAAKQATKHDLEEIWNNDFSKTVDEHASATVSFSVPVTGAGRWGTITRMPNAGADIFAKPTSWRMGFRIDKTFVDPEPYHFVEQIDRTVSWQKQMIVDLPTTNRIREALKNQGFREPIHNVDMVQLDLQPELNTDVIIYPNSLEICHVHRSGVDNAELFWQISQIVLSEMGIWNDVHQQTQTVIGSPEYFHRSAAWTWEVGGYEVRYDHGKNIMDTLRVTLERD